MNSNETIKIAKSLKCPFIKITPNYICGTDLSFSYFSITFVGGEEDFVGTVAELEGKPTPAWADNIRKDNINSCLIHKINIFLMFHNGTIKPFKVIEDMRDDNFNKILSYKMDDGAGLYSFDENHMLYMFPALCPVTKADKISAELYENNNISYFIKFNIDKKKYVIHRLILARYLA